MKKLLLCILAGTMASSMTTLAQNGYTLKTRTETYTPITGGTVLNDPNDTAHVSLGFDFTIDGVRKSKVYLSRPSMGTKDRYQFRTFWAELQSGVKSFKVTGNAGSRVAIIQYAGQEFAHIPWLPDSISYQVHLFEQDQSIEVHIGPSYITDADQAYYFALGGPAIGMKGMWLVGNPANPTIDTSTIEKYLTGTPANGQVYRFEPKTTSIYSKAKSANDITLYPNPGNNVINIAINKPDRYSVTIYDMLQRKVLQQPLNKAINTINISRLHTGSYTIQVSDNEQVLRTFKYLKQ